MNSFTNIVRVNQISVGNPEGKKPFGRFERKEEDNMILLKWMLTNGEGTDRFSASA
jgi:hypothetical protein